MTAAQYRDAVETIRRRLLHVADDGIERGLATVRVVSQSAPAGPVTFLVSEVQRNAITDAEAVRILRVKSVPAGTLENREVLATTPRDADNHCPLEKVEGRTYWSSDHSYCYRLGPSLLGANNVVSARPAKDRDMWALDLTYSPGAFRQIATEFVGRQIAIVVNGVVMSAPTINAGITGDNVRISGVFDEAAARSLANALDPLPGALSVRFVVERS